MLSRVLSRTGDVVERSVINRLMLSVDCDVVGRL
jgi:hypothetical protein